MWIKLKEDQIFGEEGGMEGSDRPQVHLTGDVYPYQL